MVRRRGLLIAATVSACSSLLLVGACDGGASTLFSDGVDAAEAAATPTATTTLPRAGDSQVADDGGVLFADADAPAGDAGVDACVPRTCAEAKATCGVINDGCGHRLSCGTCTAPETCSGISCKDFDSGLPACNGLCVPKTCDDIKPTICGPYFDGCGDIINCMTDCSPRDAAAPCTPKRCGEVENHCGGESPDGCGGLINCGPAGPLIWQLNCGYGRTCKGGGCVACAEPSLPTCGDLSSPALCLPRSWTCAYECTGVHPDGCGGVMRCDGGTACPVSPGDAGRCIPKTCEEIGATCGERHDGCGGALNCGTCSASTRCMAVPAKFGTWACVPCP